MAHGFAGITGGAEAVETLVAQMRELLDEPASRARSRLIGRDKPESRDAGEEWSALELLQRQAQTLAGSGTVLGDESQGVISAARERIKAKRHAMEQRIAEGKAKYRTDVEQVDNVVEVTKVCLPLCCRCVVPHVVPLRHVK